MYGLPSVTTGLCFLALIFLALSIGETGVTVFRLDKGMDTGPIYRQVVYPITSSSTSQSLLSELANLGAKPVLETITAISVGEKAPSEWNVVTMDLWKDMGNFNLTGMAPTCDKGEEAYFDSIILGPSIASLDAYKVENHPVAIVRHDPARSDPSERLEP